MAEWFYILVRGQGVKGRGFSDAQDKDPIYHVADLLYELQVSNNNLVVLLRVLT